MKILYQNLQSSGPFGRLFLWKVIKHSSYTIFLQCLLVGMLMAESGAGQGLSEIKLSLQLKDGTLMQAFKIIEGQTNLKFVYNQEQVKQYKNLDFGIKDQDMGQVMEILLKNTALTYQHINNNIIILPKETGQGIQAEPIRGKVTNGETGEPIPGVNIIINGSNIGTVTDIDGNYSINVPEGDAGGMRRRKLK